MASPTVSPPNSVSWFAQSFAPNRLWWALNLWLKRLGPSGVVGLGLGVFAGMFYLSMMVPAQQELRELQQNIVVAQERLQRAAASPQRERQTPAEQLAQFYRFFPSDNAVPESLRKIYQLAGTHDLLLEQGSYRVAPDKQGRLARYEISFPLKGPYPKIRQFLRAVLAQVPGTSLDKVDFEKQKIEGDVVHASVTLMLFAKRDT